MNTYATNPLWQVVDGPYKLQSFNATTGAFTHGPEHQLQRPARDPDVHLRGLPFTSNAAQFNAVKSKSVDVGFIPPEDVPQMPSRSRAWATTTTACPTSA